MRPRAPGPDLRAHVVEDRHARAPRAPREGDAEVRRVDQHHELGLALAAARARAGARRRPRAARRAAPRPGRRPRSRAGPRRSRRRPSPSRRRRGRAGARRADAARSSAASAAAWSSPEASPATSRIVVIGELEGAASRRPRAAPCAAPPAPRRLRRPAPRACGSPSRKARSCASSASSRSSSRLWISTRALAALRRPHAPRDHHRLGEEVDREVAVGLEEAHLAHRRRRDAAGGEVRQAAAREVEPRVGDVDLAGEHRHADRVDALGLLADQPLHDVEVVDHEVAHDVDVGGAAGEGTHAVRLDEARPRGSASAPSGRAALNHSRWPTWTMRPRSARQGEQLLGLRRATRRSASRPARRGRPRGRRTPPRSASPWAPRSARRRPAGKQRAEVPHGGRAVRARRRLGAREVEIRDAGEAHARLPRRARPACWRAGSPCGRRRSPRRAGRSRPPPPGSRRPSTPSSAMPAASASRTIASRSSTSVRPASTASSPRPALGEGANRREADRRHVEARILAGASRPSPRRRRRARARSRAGSSRRCPRSPRARAPRGPRTTTVWPTSSSPSALAIGQAKATSASCAGAGATAPSAPSPASSSGASSAWGSSSKPSASSARAKACRIESSLRSRASPAARRRVASGCRRPGASKSRRLRHLPGEHDLLHLLARAGRRTARSSWPEREPGAGVDRVRELRIREALERDGRDAPAAAARAARQLEGQPAEPGDQSDGGAQRPTGRSPAPRSRGSSADARPRGSPGSRRAPARRRWRSAASSGRRGGRRGGSARRASGGKSRRRRPTTFRPESRARSPGHQREGRHVLRHRRGGRDHRRLADPRELVDAREAADHRVVVDLARARRSRTGSRSGPASRSGCRGRRARRS